MSLFSTPRIYYAPAGDGGGGATAQPPKGVSPAAKNLENVLSSLDESNKRLYKMLNKTLGVGADDKDDDKGQSLKDALLEPFQELRAAFNPKEMFKGILGGDEDGLLGGILGENGSDKQKPKEKPKMGDMMKLATGDSMGFTFLYWKLDEIAGLLRTGGSDGKEEKGKGIGGFFKGLLKGAVGLAVLAGSMMLFAGALLLFTQLEGSDWAKALAGIGMFALFVAGAVVVAKIVSNNEKTFEDFAKGVFLLTGALILFGAAIFVMAKVQPYVPDAVDGMKLFGAFVIGAAVVSRIVGDNLKDFAQLGIGMILLTGALILFGAAVFVMDWVSPYLPGAMDGIATFIGFVAAAAILSRVVGANIGAFIQFAAGTILLTVGLGLFAGAIWLVNKVAPVEAVLGAIPAVLGMLALAGVGVAVGVFLGASMPAFIAFALGSIAMSLSLMLFGAAVRSVQEISLEDLTQAGIIVAAMLVFSVAAAGVGMLLGTVLLPGIFGFAIGATAMSVSLMIFGAALGTVLDITLEDLQTAEGIINTISVLAITAAAVGMGLLFTIPALAAFAVAGTALSVGLVAFGAAIQAVKESGDHVDLAMPALQKMMTFLSNPAGGIDAEGNPTSGGYPGVIQLIDGMNGPVRRKMERFGEALVPFSEGMLGFAQVIKLVAEIGSKDLIDAAVNGVANMMGFLVGGGPADVPYEQSVAGMMEGMKRRVSNRLEDFGNALGPLSSALLDFTQVIQQTANMEGMVEKAKPAIRAMVEFLTEGNKTSPSIATLVAAVTPAMSRRMGRFGEGLSPLAEGLNTFAGVINQVKGITAAEIDTAIGNLDKMMVFLTSASTMAGDVGGGKFLGLGSSNMEKFEDALVPFGGGVRTFVGIARDMGTAAADVEASEAVMHTMVRMLTAAGAIVDRGGPDRINEFAYSLDLLGEGISKFNGEVEGTTPFVLDRIADALERIAEIQFGQMFTPFIQFMSHNEQLKETATQLERISEAIEPKEPNTLDRIGGAIGSIFNRQGGSRTALDDTAAAMPDFSESGVEANVATLTGIITKWDTERQPIVLTGDADTNIVVMPGGGGSGATNFGGNY